MKQISMIAALVAGLILMQACGSKNGKTERELSAGDSIALQQKLDSTKAANDKVERDKARAERKRLADERKAKETYDRSGVTIYNRAEVKPSFKGGETAMNKYFKDNLKYPEAAENKGWRGKVYVDFVVGPDGKVQYAEITEDTDPDTEQAFKDEALRVVMAMPTWVPGSQQGKKVAVSYNLPIEFFGSEY